MSMSSVDWKAARSTIKAAVARIGQELNDLLTALNTIGSALLEYAMQNPDVANNFLPFLPHQWRATVGPMLPPIWWLIVQVAKARAIQKAQNA